MKNILKKILIVSCFFLIISNLTKGQCGNWDIFGPASFCNGFGAFDYFLIDQVNPCNGGMWVVQGGTINFQNQLQCNVTWNNPSSVPRYIAHVVTLNNGCPNPTVGDTVYMQECCFEVLPNSPYFFDGDVFDLEQFAISLGFTISSPAPQLIIDNAQFSINGILLIRNGQELTLRNCSVYMGPGAMIKFQRQAAISLSIEASTTLKAITSSNTCLKPPTMWYGIKMGEGNVITVDNSTIQDAQFAITILEKAGLILTDSEFKANYVTVYIPDLNQFFCNNYIYIQSLVQNNLFQGLPLVANGNFFNGQYPNPQNNACLTGFLIHNVKSSSFDFSLNGTNTFTRLNNGIAGYNSHLSVYNCQFTGMEFQVAYSNYAFSGYAVSSENYINDVPFPVLNVGTASNTNSIVGPNGIYVFGNTQTNILSNSITNSTNSISYGVLMRQNRKESITITSNNFNYATHGVIIFEMSNATPQLTFSDNVLT